MARHSLGDLPELRLRLLAMAARSDALIENSWDRVRETSELLKRVQAPQSPALPDHKDKHKALL